MTRTLRRIAVLLAIIAFAVLYSRSAHAEEFNEKGWFVPDVEAYGLKLSAYTTKKDLVSRCPGREHVQTLWMVNGYRFPDDVRAKYGIESEEGLVLVAVNTLGDNVTSVFIDVDLEYPMELTLVDREGDGVFRHLYGPKDRRIDTPEWILELCNGTD
ncbi:hypothetical protein DPQ33_04545 [Oceanidesulfovibrio indonesiensis]|uniref:Uncharacterized protein n=1 Tax=Oceanidesulfovibrio indonesiensis TaxID=54767 RepID=A0A7M3MGY5_9BACT|nr:hypothetical protein [Oceanidesulfovibrio indonesiensis]TVM18746.1 hypothetical protein DPQ33_04545 [Oceanidesulfovibrio indonesiensis]